MTGGSVPGLTGGNLAGGRELAELGTKENGTAVANASVGNAPPFVSGPVAGVFATFAGGAVDTACALGAPDVSAGFTSAACSGDSTFAIARRFLCRTTCSAGCCSTCCGCAAGGGAVVGICRWMGSSVSGTPGSRGDALSGAGAGGAGTPPLGADDVVVSAGAVCASAIALVASRIMNCAASAPDKRMEYFVPQRSGVQTIVSRAVALNTSHCQYASIAPPSQ